MDLFLNKRNTQNFSGFHPWVLDRSIIEPTSPPPPGQIVELMSASGSWIGRGVYNPNSRIRVRLYQWRKEESLDFAWLSQRLQEAVSMRQRWMLNHEKLDAVRWVNSEGDQLSGLIVDQFGDFLSIHITALAMLAWEQQIVDWFAQALAPQGIFVKVDQNTANAEGTEPKDYLAAGTEPTEPIVIHEGPAKIAVDLGIGQKTGYYLDQRSNRRRAARWFGTGPMLDVCCYLGGFSLAAATIAKPSKITAVDTSARVIQQAQRNAELNGAAIEFVQADCFDYLTSLQQSGAKFDSIVLDPPKMASNRNQIQSALRAYHRLNLSAVNLLQPGGVLVTCSCSGRISRDDFRGMLGSVAQRSRRTIQVIEALGADFDHPVSVNCPETEYLKCFICRVL
ncbi:MAG: class I SAM-dependent rRNA methyltransferase [Pirellulales bacterium]